MKRTDKNAQGVERGRWVHPWTDHSQEDFYKAVGEMLRALRGGDSQVALAAASGVRQTTISRYERGSSMDLWSFCRLAWAEKVDEAYFLGETLNAVPDLVRAARARARTARARSKKA